MNVGTKNIEDIQRVLSYPAAVDALKKYNVNNEQMKAAVATLSDARTRRDSPNVPGLQRRTSRAD